MINWQAVEQQNPLFADILVTNGGGWPIALVEVKNLPGMTSESATAIRRNLIVHGLVSQQVPYFLIVSQDTGLLWTQRPESRPEDPPTAEFPMQPVVSHYANWLSPGERLIGGSLEFVVANWLSDLSTGFGPDLAETTDPLKGTGFLESLRDAAVNIAERA